MSSGVHSASVSCAGGNPSRATSLVTPFVSVSVSVFLPCDDLGLPAPRSEPLSVPAPVPALFAKSAFAAGDRDDDDDDEDSDGAEAVAAVVADAPNTDRRLASAIISLSK
jgi:hypothetical protein